MSADHVALRAAQEVWSELRRTGIARRRIRLADFIRLTCRIRNAARKDRWSITATSDTPPRADVYLHGHRMIAAAYRLNYEATRKMSGGYTGLPLPPDFASTHHHAFDELIAQRVQEARQHDADDRDALLTVYRGADYAITTEQAEHAWRHYRALARGALWADERCFTELAQIEGIAPR